VGVTGSLDIVALNRVVGIATAEGLSNSVLDEIVDLVRETRPRRFAVQVCPEAQSEDFLNRLRDHGFTLFNHWMKLSRPVHRPFEEPASTVRIERIGIERAAEFASILVPAYNYPGPVRSWITAMVGRSNWYHYIAFEDNVPVATAALFVTNGIGWLGFAATDPEHRKHGAQSALIARRINDARDLGCKMLVVETGVEKVGLPNPSLHNLQRFGFDIAYERPNYLRIKTDMGA
jgi:GNAT superfamily N-acetyltransferase